MRRKLLSATLTLITLLSAGNLLATVRYVDSSSTAAMPDGLSWATAFAGPQEAINASAAGDTVWVAKGTYTALPAFSFSMKEGVKIYGGFSNTDTGFSQRNPAANLTMLSRSNPLHAIVENVQAAGITVASVLDGFVLKKGHNSNGGGGAISNSQASPTISNCVFDSDSSLNGGGAINNGYSNPVIFGCTFTNNYTTNSNSDYGGGAIFNYSCQHVVITNCTFTGNISRKKGGAVSNLFSTAVIDSCTFSANTARSSGGAVYCYGSTLTLTAATFTGNNVTKQSTPDSATMYAYGGAISSMFGGNVSISGCTFSGNSINITNASVSNNYCYSYGGAVYVESELVGTLASAINGCTFLNNAINTDNHISARSHGGALYQTGGTMVVAGCAFTGNKTNYTSGAACTGAVEIKNTQNTNNAPSTTVADCSFTQNGCYKSGIADGSGGALALSADTSLLLPVLVKNSSLSQNGALNGAAISCSAGSFGITGCTFNANRKAGYGGGIYANGSKRLSLLQSSFINDTAVSGGGLYTKKSAIQLANCLFYHCAADSFGAAACHYHSMAKAVNNTYACNWAGIGGGGIYNADTTTTILANSIVWGNNSGVQNNTTGSDSITYSLVQGHPASTSLFNLDGATDPLFVDTAGGNFQFLPSSPCINAGNNDSLSDTVTADLANNARIYNSIIDMGAYEFNILPPVQQLGNDTTICAGTVLVLDAQNPNSHYLWNTGDTTRTITVTTAGTYTVTVSNVEGIMADTIQVMVDTVTVHLGNDTTLTNGGTLTLHAGNAGASYIWSTGAITQSITVSATGNYSVLVTDPSGCTASDTIAVTILSTGIAGTAAGRQGSSIVPNPAHESITIITTQPALTGTIATLYDASGRPVKTINVVTDKQPVNVTNLPSGIYLLQLQNGEHLRFVKQ